MPPAHPRVCGENYLHMNSMPQANGSSPRVRGKPRSQHRAGHRPGLIPACAGKTRASHATSTSHSAHPRVCGENAGRGAPGRRRCGSSPRVRGKRAGRSRRGRARRLIPACAGKTSVAGRPPRRHPAHPRVCGENSSSMVSVASVAGSSPRVRGKRLRRLARHSRGRLIPACAGKTAPVPTLMVSSTAHPRVCGENILMDINKLLLGGSSPRVRGKPWGYPPGTLVTWLIPACAGKTCALRPSRGRARAHPRVCGENRPRQRRQIVVAGSSPRVRGKRLGGDVERLPVRLIPACAGKTVAARCGRPPLPAHPRVCGENGSTATGSRQCWGSSPRVRGKRLRHRGHLGAGGLIPACAGKTRHPSPYRLVRGSHPRVCGENAHGDRVVGRARGSSPRVRGKPYPPRRPRPREGLIPACAGKTPPGP